MVRVVATRVCTRQKSLTSKVQNDLRSSGVVVEVLGHIVNLLSSYIHDRKSLCKKTRFETEFIAYVPELSFPTIIQQLFSVLCCGRRGKNQLFSWQSNGFSEGGRASQSLSYLRHLGFRIHGGHDIEKLKGYQEMDRKDARDRKPS